MHKEIKMEDLGYDTFFESNHYKLKLEEFIKKNQSTVKKNEAMKTQPKEDDGLVQERMKRLESLGYLD